jgi:hypothetical protein
MRIWNGKAPQKTLHQLLAKTWSNPAGENVNFVIVTIVSGYVPQGERVGLGRDLENESFLFSQDGTTGTYRTVSVAGIGTTNITTSINYDRYSGKEADDNVTIEYRWGQSIRTSDLVCQRVWVNEKGNFQFVFWYAYRDNNWVKIYDMNGKEVYSINMPYDNPQFEVSLPDGMYTVKTFSIDQTKPIQTFIIGKP